MGIGICKAQRFSCTFVDSLEFGHNNEFDWNRALPDAHDLWYDANLLQEIESFLHLPWLSTDDSFDAQVDFKITECDGCEVGFRKNVPMNAFDGILLHETGFHEVKFEFVNRKGAHLGVGLITKKHEFNFFPSVECEKSLIIIFEKSWHLKSGRFQERSFFFLQA